MSKGFSGFPGNMKNMMQQAQKMQEQLLKTQEQASLLTAEGSSGGGMVKVTMNGKHQVVSLGIDKQVVNPDDVEMLQDLIVAAVNEASKKAQEIVKAEISKVTGSMGLPPGLMP